jgi:glycerophosphoryl diester phosphodiesterase
MNKNHKPYIVLLIYAVLSIVVVNIVINVLPKNQKIIDLSKISEIKLEKKVNLNYTNSIKFIGHRGISESVPENTIPSFELLGKLGFWGAECDARTTSDGRWIIMHDATVNRMTNGKGKVEEIPYNELEKLKVIAGANIKNFKDLKVPTLKEYLQSCNKWGVTPVIEMKPANNKKYYSEFISEIKLYDKTNNVVVISLSRSSLNKLHELDSNLTLGLICSEINKEDIGYVKSIKNGFLDCWYKNIDKKSIDLCHKSNIKVGVWTIDDKLLANKYEKYGADYLTTDMPLQLRES